LLPTTTTPQQTQALFAANQQAALFGNTAVGGINAFQFNPVTASNLLQPAGQYGMLSPSFANANIFGAGSQTLPL
jgi:hypothetical protein